MRLTASAECGTTGGLPVERANYSAESKREKDKGSEGEKKGKRLATAVLNVN